MEQFVRYLRGYVKIRLISKTPERFLKLCAHHGISLMHVAHRDGYYEMEISLKDFFRLKPVCRKSFSRIHILQKSGLPFFFYQNKKRKAFFVGIFCCLCLLFLCSTRIWNIHVEGNYSYSTQSILGYLEQEDIVHGIARNKLNCGQIAASLRQHFPDITWVSARIKGTRLLITIQENMDHPSLAEEKESSPCDLVADQDGIIVHMVTRQGVPKMGIGQSCKTGDLLVSGRLEILNDSKEVVRYEYVESDADVYIQRNYSYEDEIPVIYEKRVYTGEVQKQLCLQLLNYRVNLRIPHKGYQHYDQVSNLQPAKLTENYVLPLWVGTVEDREYEIHRFRYSEAELREIAQEHLRKFIRELSEKGVKVSQNNVKISLNEKSCISKGAITVVEKIGKRAPVEVLQEPQERTLANEQ